MKSIVLKFSEIDTKDRLTVDHYLSEDLITIKELEKSPYSLVYLGDLAIIKGGKRLPPKARYSASGIPYIRVVDIGKYEIKLDDVVYISEELHQKINRYQLRKDDIGIVIVGATIGKTAIFKSSVSPCNFNENLARITVQHQKLSPYFLLAYLQSPFGQAYISWLTGGSAQAKLSLERIAKIRVPVPPRSLQDQIAQVMQEAYGDRQKKLEEAKKLLNSSSKVVLEELDLEISELKDEKYFTVSISKMAGGRFDLDLYNTRYTGLIELLQEKFDSTLTPLKAISHQITSGATPLGSKYFESGVAFLRVQNLNEKGEIDFDDCLFVSEEFAKTLKRATIQNGDILLVIVGATIGKSAVVKDIEHPAVTNQALARIRIRETVDLLPEFLQAFLNSPVGQIQISSLKRPVAQGNLSLTETGQILVPMIPLSQQEKVISRVQAYRNEAKRLRTEAEAVVAAAKARVERMILGEKTVD